MAENIQMEQQPNTESSSNHFKDTIISLLKAREMSMVYLILFACIVMTILSPYFFSITNFVAIIRGFSMEGMVVIGMSMLLIAGAFDLSVGSVMALSGIISAWLIVKADMPYAISVLGGLGVGSAVGLVNGLLVTKVRVNPLIATLGMMTVTRGLALGFTQGNPVINVPLEFAWIGQGNIGGVPVPFIIMMIILIVTDFLFRRSRIPRQLYYIGGNDQAARLSGIQVDKLMVIIFIASGFFAALGGIISMARLTSGIPTAFSGVELRIIAACVIGGMSLSGGEGSVLGALLGLVFMAIVSNAMTLFGVSIYWEGVVTGSILIIAVAIDMLSRRRAA